MILKAEADKGSDTTPWINGIKVDEAHLNRLFSQYIRYYHQECTHRGLGEETPGCRIAVG